MGKSFNFLCMCCGKSPEKFDFEYKDSFNVYHYEKDLTLISFYQQYYME